MRSRDSVMNDLVAEAKKYEAIIIKVARNKLLNTQLSYKIKGRELSDREIIQYLLGLTGTEFIGDRAKAKSQVQLVEEFGGKGIKLSSNRKKIIENLTNGLSQETNIDNRKKGVYLEQVGQDYVNSVMQNLFNEKLAKESGNKDKQDLGYDWSLKFKINKTDNLSKEDKEKIKNGIKIEHKASLNKFHITDSVVHYNSLPSEFKDIDWDNVSIGELAKFYLILQKFNNNYPIFFSVKDEDFLFSSQILTKWKNNIYLKDININEDKLKNEIENTFQETYGFSDEEKDIYANQLKQDNNLYNSFRNEIIEYLLEREKLQGSLWYSNNK